MYSLASRIKTYWPQSSLHFWAFVVKSLGPSVVEKDAIMPDTTALAAAFKHASSIMNCAKTFQAQSLTHKCKPK